MYAQLGDIVFQNLFVFTEYSKSATAGYAEHKPLVGKPLLQPTGPSLNELSLSIRLHVAFCKPEQELATLKQYMNDNEILKLINGSKIEDGKYVITDLSETIEDADVMGGVFSYIVNLSLREYIIPDKVQAEKTNNKDNAAAVGDKKPVAEKKVNPPTCPKEISKLVTSIDNRSKQINKVVEQLGGANSVENRKILNESTAGIMTDCDDLGKRVANSSSCIFNNDPIKQNAANVSTAASIMDMNLLSGASFLTRNDAQSIAAYVAKLKAAAQPIIQQAITGK